MCNYKHHGNTYSARDTKPGETDASTGQEMSMNVVYSNTNPLYHVSVQPLYS